MGSRVGHFKWDARLENTVWSTPVIPSYVTRIWSRERSMEPSVGVDDSVGHPSQGWSYRREISHISHFWPTCPDVAQAECEIFVKFTRGNLRPPIAVSQKFHTSSMVTRWLLGVISPQYMKTFLAPPQQSNNYCHHDAVVHRTSGGWPC